MVHAASVAFGYVPPPYGALWPRIVELLTVAVERGGNDWDELGEMLADGRAQLWLGVTDMPEVAAVSRMDGDTFEVWLAGGKVLSGFLPFLETAIQAAKEGGATNGRITGRKGWERVLRPYGWRPNGDDLVKDFAA